MLLQPFGPDKIPELHLIINKSRFMNNLHYLEGSSLDEADLKRCVIEKAEAVIILSDKLSFDPGQQDNYTILQAMFLKKYLNKNQKEENNTMVCMQFLRYISITHYSLSLRQEETKDDQYVCIEQLKLSLLAKSCLCPGLVVLITNLIKSSLNNKEIDNLLDEKKDDPNYTWLWEYWEGKKYEIYRISIPNCYAD